MGNRNLELIVGLFVLIGLCSFLFLSLEVSALDSLHSGDAYRVKSHFNDIGGLKKGASVKLSGVSIGWVAKIDINRVDYQAQVLLMINSQYDNIPADSSTKIYTSGLLGEKYIGISPGGDDNFLQDGDEILISGDALVLEDVIGQFLYKKAAGD